jgi:hypothetical protein
MTQWISKLTGLTGQSAVRSAYDDIAHIAHEALGMNYLYVPFFQRSSGVVQGWTKKEESQLQEGILAGFADSDTLFLQFPTWNYPTFDTHLIQKVKNDYHGRVVLIVLDFEPLQFANLVNLKYTIDTLNLAHVLVLASAQLHEWLVANGLRDDLPVVYQNVFDFLLETENQEFESEKPDTIAYIGDINKTGDLINRRDIDIEVWNQGPEPDDLPTNVRWRGRYYQKESRLGAGYIGLVWTEWADDDLPNYGLMNNPYKLGLYLANGIPVIVPEASHAAEFVLAHRLGVTVNSLDEITKVVTNTDWHELRANAQNMASLISAGHFTKLWLLAAEERLLI